MKKIVLMASLLGLAGCSNLMSGAAPETAEELVATKATQRYEALMGGDYRKAYKQMTPGYRILNSLEDFKQQHAGVGSWASVRVGRVVCAEDMCRAGVSFEYRHSGVSGAQKPGGAFRDIWREIDGQWYYIKPE